MGVPAEFHDEPRRGYGALNVCAAKKLPHYLYLSLMRSDSFQCNAQLLPFCDDILQVDGAVLRWWRIRGKLKFLFEFIVIT